MNEYLDKAKQVALFMLDMPYENVKGFEGLFIAHAYFDSVYLADKEGLFSIKEDPQRFERLKAGYRNMIHACDSIESVFSRIRNAEKINYLYLLSQRDVPDAVCGYLLGGVWCMLENNDTQQPYMRAAMRKWLLAADKMQIMSDSDRAVLDRLPEKVTIYRGGQFDEPVKGFCWSLNRNVALWFANRFQNKNPVVHTATIKKQDILFYTNAANEEEAVVDYTKLRNIVSQKL